MNTENISEEGLSDNMEIWESSIALINKYLEEILFKIEWNYGDCRTPFLFPPKFDVKRENNHCEYSCYIKLEFSDDEILHFRTDDPSLLPQLIIDDFAKRYSFLK
ncbi:hypothetical protein ACFLR4_03215 [Bacteroidota bacterium]